MPDKPAMTMSEISAALGHTKPAVSVQPSAYLVSCLPESHADRYLFTVQVEYRGNGQWSVKNRTRLLGKDGTWSFGFAWSEGGHEPATSDEMDRFDKEQEAWLAEHRFDEATAIRLAKEAARSLSYRGYDVAAALATPAP